MQLDSAFEIAAAAFHLGEEPAGPEAVVPEPALSYAGELDTAPDPRTDVDDLFARIRAAGPAEVAAEGPAAEPAAAGAPADHVDAAYFGDRADARRCRRRSLAT